MELVRFPSRGGYSVRSIFTFVLTVVLAAFLWVVFSVNPAHAQTATTATWSGTDVILFDGHGFSQTSEISDTTGTIPEGATIYKAPLQPSDNSNSQKLLVLFFAPGVDPPTATSVQYVEFDDTNGTLSNPTSPKTIELAEQGTSDGTGSSCSVGGIGWIICPVSVFLAESMDNLFNLIDDLIKTQPLMLGDTDNPMYTAWNVSRTIANVAFVIVFLIIIFSQLTNIGISNYGLKRLIPRLIVAAVLVNISYYISAIAIDLSNIVGYSIQDIFIAIRQDVFHMTNDTFAGVNNNPWTAVTSVVLAGGGIIGGIYYLSAAGPYVLVTLLIGLGLVALFILLILAARQAIIVILVIISPLAFVANLLPNTEKWFERWKDLFMTMLIFFPAFAMVFSGSQLAGQLIIQNAGDNIVTVIFGLAVQVAPLVVTPYLLKFSGGLLGRIAQMANDPRKGILDRTRNWQRERSELHRQHALQKNTSGIRKLRPAAAVQSVENRRRRRKELTDMYKLRADTKWQDSKPHQKIAERTFEAETEKQIVETKHKTHIQSLVNTQSHKFHLQNTQMEAGKRALEETVKVTEATTMEYNAGHLPTGVRPELQRAISQMQTSRQNTAIEGMRASKAEGQIQRDLAEALSKSAELRERAGGIQPLGSHSVLASAVSAVRRADAEDIKNIQDASDLKPGDLAGATARMVSAIQAGNSIEARAYQNMLVTAGGAGMEEFRRAMLKLGPAVPVDVSEAMRDNLLNNHGAIKAKANDLIDWAAKGGIMEAHTYNAQSWAGLSDKDFIGQHPKTQAYALDKNVNAFSPARARSILEADAVEGNVLTPDVKKMLQNIAGLTEDE